MISHRRPLLVALLACATLATGMAPAPAAPLDLAEPVSTTNLSTGDTLRLGSEPNRAARVRTGLATYRLDVADANTFAAQVDSTVPAGAELALDVRGRMPDGQWTEWTEIRPSSPAVLPVAVDEAEVRAMLSTTDSSPELRAVTVTPSVTRAPATSTVRAAGAGLTYELFATREGLVGGTTANGHKIVERDHFVALPSRRGLSANGKGDYSVRVCAKNGRCEWAPTWDVGPWNTRDDHWNPAGQRQEWADLPQGRPQSQAAYQDGYNGGKDQFGRKVANPAGIDLADGTFWDGLKLTNNSWVSVTYQWTGSLPFGYVDTFGTPLNVRSGTDTSHPAVGMAAEFAQVRIECQTTGASANGTQGTSNVWYRLAPGMFAAAAYVAGATGVPAC